jgi:hypothetical protein
MIVPDFVVQRLAHGFVLRMQGVGGTFIVREFRPLKARGGETVTPSHGARHPQRRGPFALTIIVLTP